MPWVKRNLGLVISSIVALGLLGFATYYLLLKKAKADEASNSLQTATERLQSLVTRIPGVSTENINTAKEDQKEIEKFLAEIKRFFVTPSYPTQVNSSDFGVLLLNKTSELRRMAKISGVSVPQGYQFSFGSQVKAVNIPASALEPLTVQLAEIESICNVLFQSKIHELQTIRRSPVTSDETAGAADFLNAKPVTNDWTIITPYDVTFKGFSADLANVMEGLIKASNCIVIRDLVVQRADGAHEGDDSSTPGFSGTPVPQEGASNPYSRYGLRPGVGPGGMPPDLARRYGMPMRPTPPPPTTPVPQGGRRGPATVQDEHQLKITLSLETVRARPADAIAKAAPPPVADPAVPPAEAGTEPAIQ